VTGRERKELLNFREAGDFLGLSVNTIRHHIYVKRLLACRVVGERLLRIRRNDLEGLLNSVFEGEDLSDLSE